MLKALDVSPGKLMGLGDKDWVVTKKKMEETARTEKEEAKLKEEVTKAVRADELSERLTQLRLETTGFDARFTETAPIVHRLLRKWFAGGKGELESTLFILGVLGKTVWEEERERLLTRRVLAGLRRRPNGQGPQLVMPCASNDIFMPEMTVFV